MKSLIKRLEVIKNCILLGDEELIPSQLAKLPQTSDERIVIIVQTLVNEQYSDAIGLIESYIQRNMGLVVYEDSQIAGLRLELKRLEQKILALSEEKQTTQQLINEFRTQYHLQLGELLQSILDYNYRILFQKNLIKLKEHTVIKETIATAEATIEIIKAKIKRLQEKALDNDDALDELQEAFNELKAEKERLKQAQEQLDDYEEELEEDEEYQEYEQAKQDKEEFDEEIEEIIEQHKNDLPEEDMKQLKKLYRKASKLCHPDTVAEEHKEQAHELMVALNVAYEKQDIKEVERILKLLESGAGFVASSDKIDNSEALKAKIAELTQKLNTLTQEIETLKNDDTYQTVQSLDDWDAYFDHIKTQLHSRVAMLETEYQQLVETLN